MFVYEREFTNFAFLEYVKVIYQNEIQGRGWNVVLAPLGLSKGDTDASFRPLARMQPSKPLPLPAFSSRSLADIYNVTKNKISNADPCNKRRPHNLALLSQCGNHTDNDKPDLPHFQASPTFTANKRQTIGE
jgi:hypothetical protein